MRWDSEVLLVLSPLMILTTVARITAKGKFRDFFVTATTGKSFLVPVSYVRQMDRLFL